MTTKKNSIKVKNKTIKMKKIIYLLENITLNIL